MQNSLHSKRFQNPVRRILMLLIGIECATFGISCTALSGLGTTPISSLPFVLSKIFPLTFGTTTFILNVFFVLIEAVLLRSRFTVLNLHRSRRCSFSVSSSTSTCGFSALMRQRPGSRVSP